MRKEEIRKVLDELSVCIELDMGLNVFMEHYGGLHPTFAFNILDSDVGVCFPCIEKKLHELGLCYRYVRRGEWIYFQIYDPEN